MVYLSEFELKNLSKARTKYLSKLIESLRSLKYRSRYLYRQQKETHLNLKLHDAYHLYKPEKEEGLTQSLEVHL